MSGVCRFANLAAHIESTSPPAVMPVRLVAIDGPGGSGKSSFARRLAAALDGAPVVHTDDFATESEPIQWWPLLEEGVLRPFAAGRPARFQPYDWSARRRAGLRVVPAAAVVLIEGVSSARAAVRDRLTYSVWIQTSRQERLRRGLERDGQEQAGLWAGWMAQEDAFYATDATPDAVDLVVDGDPQQPHEREWEFVVIRSGR